MENEIPSRGRTAVIERVAGRAAAARLETYADEVQRLVDATYAEFRRSGNLDPRVADIVKRAGLSNQAFYRHFASKDALLLAVVADGQSRLLETIERRMARAAPGLFRVRAWIEAVLAQAQDDDAAANTRPFAVNGMRLADQFPAELTASNELVIAPLRAAVIAAHGDGVRDANAVYQLVLGTMHAALVGRRRPTAAEVQHVVKFALAGIEGGHDGT